MKPTVSIEKGVALGAHADSNPPGARVQQADIEVRRPQSATVTWINWTALASLFATVIALRRFEVVDPVDRTLIVMAAIAVPVIVLEGLYFKRFAGMAYRRDAFATRLKRVVVKLIGLAATFGLMVATYWVFPYFANGSSYLVYDLLGRVWVPIVVLAPVYFWYVDGLMDDPEDDYHAAGMFVLGILPDGERAKLGNHLRASFMKIFFYQYILSVAVAHLTGIVSYDPVATISAEPFGFMNLFIDTVWFVDVAFSCTGYFLTLRLFDSHIRSTDPTVLGWLVCLICYGTFYGMLSESFLPYEDGVYWGHWLAATPVLKALWAIPIIVLLTTYALGTVQFGIRFSNLTHRGIITNGPFRFTKHPQYVSKNIAWWLISVPFITIGTPEDAIRHCLMLAGFNVIFYYRAKTEERHLSRDPVYRDYAAWIAQHGVIARMKRAVGLPTPPYRVPLTVTDSSVGAEMGGRHDERRMY